jgi:hypothetical protein
MSFDQIAKQEPQVWEDVARELLNGWGGKCKDAVRLNRNAVLATGDETDGYWLTIPVARIANELGAPVQQLFTVCALRRRATPADG